MPLHADIENYEHLIKQVQIFIFWVNLGVLGEECLLTFVHRPRELVS